LLSGYLAARLCQAGWFTRQVIFAEGHLEDPLTRIAVFANQVALAPHPTAEELSDLKSAAVSILDVITCLHRIPLSKFLFWITK
jgi:hypothetical protein